MRDVGVPLHELGDVLLVLRGPLFEVTDGQRQVSELREGGEQGRGGRRVAGVRHVVRDRAEQRKPANASLPHADLHEGGQRRRELHVVRDRARPRGKQRRVGGLHVHGRRSRVRHTRGHPVQREGDLDAGTLAQLVDCVRERLPVRIRLRAVQDQDRVTHVVFDEVKDGLRHHHVRGGHPVVHGHDRAVRTVVHERVRIEGRDPLVVQGAQELADRHAPCGAGVNRPIKVDEENLRLRAGGGTVGIQVSGVDTHVSSSC